LTGIQSLVILLSTFHLTHVGRGLRGHQYALLDGNQSHRQIQTPFLAGVERARSVLTVTNPGFVAVTEYVAGCIFGN
jgi:hypothetical protein